VIAADHLSTAWFVIVCALAVFGIVVGLDALLND
jgi:hypothetical protein